MEDNQQKVTKPQRKGGKTFLIIVLAVIMFFAGYTMRDRSTSESSKTLDWILQNVQKYYYEDYTEKQLLDMVTDCINEDILDAYSEYYTAEEYQLILAQSRGQHVGIGVVVASETDLSLYMIAGNSPAEHAGLQVGDVLVGMQYNGTETVFTDFTHFKQSLSSVPESTDFTMTVRRGANTKQVTLQRREYIENCVYYADKTLSGRFMAEGVASPEWVEQAANNDDVFDADTAYIRLTSFMGQSASQFEKAMSVLKQRGKTKLILDLRGNGGGKMNILTQIASHVVASPEQKFNVSVARYKNQKEEVFASSKCLYGEYGFAAGAVVVLADSGTASASEALIGAMLDYGTIDREHLVVTKNGETALTYGKGIMQTTFEHSSNGQAIKLTTAKIFWPKSDTCIHGTGIGTVEANRVAPATGGGTYSYDGDNELMRAKEILNN